MATQKPLRRGLRPSSATRTLALGGALILSALLTTTALRNPALHGLAWISLLPLFAAIRALGCPFPSRGGGRNQPARRSWNVSSFLAIGDAKAFAIATIAGGLWGGSVFLFAVAGDAPVIPATLATAALLVTIPAIYTGLAAALTRRIGFNPFVLAVGWIGVELALTPLNLPLGIMAAAGVQGDLTGAVAHSGSIFLQWTARLLGYVFIAFLVAAANASLIALLGRARLTLPLRRRLDGLLPTATCHPSQTPVLFLSPAPCQAHPRAPPLFAPATS